MWSSPSLLVLCIFRTRWHNDSDPLVLPHWLLHLFFSTAMA